MQGSLLTRVSVEKPESSTILTRTQAQVDQLVSGAVAQATDGKMLASMVVGATAFRLGKLGLLGLGEGSAFRALSAGGALASEVSAFEISHRLLSSGSGDAARLWRWQGSAGLRQGLIQSFITFGSLKGAGRLAQEQNFIAQHLFQDTALVFSHQALAAAGLGPRPTGSLAEQFLHAEATNLEIGAGLSLAHGMAPGLHALERGLELSLPSINSFSPRTGAESSSLKMHEAFAMAGETRNPALYPEGEKEKPLIVMSEQFKDSEPPSSSGDRHSSEPPVVGGVIERNAYSWAIRNFRHEEDSGLVADLAWKIREEMWQVLNLRIDSAEARALAHGDLLSVQIHPIDGTLENYRVVLSSNLEAPPDSAEYVQWTLDPMTGALASVSDSPPSSASTHHPGFLPFYRWIDFVSDGLKSDSLFEALSPQIQEFLIHDRTQTFRGPPETAPETAPEASPAAASQAALDSPTLHQVPGPTSLVAHFDSIAEGVRDSVDRYCELHHLPEKGRRRLQRLSQFILAAIYQKELEFPKYSRYPQFHIWVVPHPEDSNKKMVLVFTAGEALQWHQERGGKVGEHDILLILDRTYWGPEETKPFIAHQYTHKDAKGLPIGADLEFQKSMGLGNNRLKVFLMDLVPTPEKMAEWAARREEP